MKQTLLQEKYPIYVAEISKNETQYQSVTELASYYQARIAENEKVHFIGVFDHFAHTTRIGGNIADGIQAAIDVIFCFGFALPSPQMLAVRPRSIGNLHELAHGLLTRIAVMQHRQVLRHRSTA